MLKKAIGYIRVSTAGQAEDEKYGIDLQKQEILKYADSNGYAVVEWKIDTASGASEDRPALNDILYGDVSNPPFEAVIVFKNDRLARDTKLYFYYLYVLDKKNIKLMSVCEEFIEGNEFANIYRALLQFVAEQERKNINIRTTKGRQNKSLQGGYSGGRPPYGYRAEKGKLIVNEHEANVVRFVFECRRQGWVLQAIADALNNSGIRTRSGRSFMVGTINHILENRRTYLGLYKYGKDGKWVQGLHEPIIEE